MSFSPSALSSRDLEYMRFALDEARKALAANEVPIGAVVVQENDLEGQPMEPKIIARAHNTREVENNPVGHAELLAIHEASQKLGRWRLVGCTLYVTLEPCLMCTGAIVLSRVDRVVYGCADPKAGGVESLYKILEDPRLNHRPQVSGGILAAECSQLLKDFFKTKRG